VLLGKGVRPSFSHILHQSSLKKGALTAPVAFATTVGLHQCRITPIVDNRHQALRLSFVNFNQRILEIRLQHSADCLIRDNFGLRDVDFGHFERRLHGMELSMCSHKQERSSGGATLHASAGDFCSVFHQDMDVLYWLALTLTSDESKAEKCFVAGLEECMGGNSVFKDWTRSWARRVVIKNAIRLMSPRPDMAFPRPIIRQQEKPRTPAEVALAALAHLALFERFVYVMSVLEGYSERDCASLLRCSSRDVAVRLEENGSEVLGAVAEVA
jgi:hypothetical protein